MQLPMNYFVGYSEPEIEIDPRKNGGKEDSPMQHYGPTTDAHREETHSIRMRLR